MIDIVKEYPVIEGEHDQYDISVSKISSVERNDDCMTQYSSKLQDEKPKTSQEFPFEEGENTRAAFQLPPLETTTNKEIPAANELEESIVIAPGEWKNLNQYSIIFAVKKWSIYL